MSDAYVRMTCLPAFGIAGNYQGHQFDENGWIKGLCCIGCLLHNHVCWCCAQHWKQNILGYCELITRQSDKSALAWSLQVRAFSCIEEVLTGTNWIGNACLLQVKELHQSRTYKANTWIHEPVQKFQSTFSCLMLTEWSYKGCALSVVCG